MEVRTRAHFFCIISLLFILLGMNASVHAQESDSTEAEEHFSRIVLKLKSHTPYIVPFPVAKEKEEGLSLAGPMTGWFNMRRIRTTGMADWDPQTGYLVYRRVIDNKEVETPRFADYMTNARVYGDQEVTNYWQKMVYNQSRKSESEKASGLFNVQIDLGDEVGGAIGAIAGAGTAGLNVSGYQKISFSGRSQWTDKESDALNRVNKFPSLDMKQISRYNIKGTIGTKISVEVDQNSERKTDLANTIKIRYKGEEDEIIQSIEAGNTNLSLPNTQFVGYSQRVQGLFGIKSTAKIGPLDLTAIISQEKGSTESSTFQAGASKSTNYKRDYDYLDRTFFWLVFPEANVAEIVESEIYVFQQQQDFGSGADEQWQFAKVAVNTENFGAFPQEDRVTTVRRLEYDDYYVYNRSRYLEMFTYDRTRLIAGWFRVETTAGDTIEIGNKPSDVVNDTLLLKLIALDQNDTGPALTGTWYNEWRNVYSLGARDIEPEGLEVKIYKGIPGTEENPDQNLSYEPTSGTPYIQIMGLDRRDVTGADNPDNMIDANDPNILLRDRGYLVFPDPQPFDPSQSYAPDGAELPETVPGIYTTRRSTITGDPSKYTKYYIEFKTSQRQTEYYLGRVNIIENSERVILNGEELKRDRDYRIFYEIGRITFLTDRVSDPNADLNIDFEYEPFITSEKKNLFGLRGEYEFNPNFKIGATVLYKSEKSTDRKPRVGQETSKSLVWDTDFSYQTELGFLTKLTDALPLVEASAPSRFNVSGEVAQSRPNPNTAGEAYVDDFESAKETVSLGVIRYQWTKPSVPSGVAGERGNIIWYNPYDPYAVTDIYNRDTRGNDRKTTLSLEFDPLEFREVVGEDPCNPDLVEYPPEDSWAGIMRSFSSASQDQTRAQILEIRMKVNRGRGIDRGKLMIDLGDISEDIDGDGFLDTEDTNSNGILEPWEDTGLDNLLSPDEPCYDSINEPDPNGDDYKYEDKYDYSKINGTEGNRFDVGGERPDTEDIDRKGSLNVTNSYFSFEFDFADNEWLVDGSDINGWKTYRIPLADSTNYDLVGNPDWGKISYGRIWLTDFDSSALIEIADINLVSTRWEEDTIRPVNIARDTLDLVTAYNVSVINTEENLDYTPPPGVTGYYDRSTDTYEKEQSLLIHFENLQFHDVQTQVEDDSGNIIVDSFEVVRVSDTVFAERELFRAEDYAGYQKIEMFVHGPEDLPAGKSNIHFIFRLGTNSENFYQFQTNIRPGWHDSNHVLIDFNQITPLKDELLRLKAEDPTIRQLKQGRYAVQGSPSLTSIIYFAAGVTNDDTLNYEPISGDLWLDELRVTDVRDDNGIAMRLSVAGGFSDFINYSVSYKNQDEYFRNLTASNSSNLGSGKRETSYSYTTKVSVDKLLPPSWGASLPITYNWSRRESTPRLKPGSDIIIPDDQLEEETTRSTSTRFSISQSFRKQGGNLLFGLLLNRLKTSFSFSETQSKSPTVPSSQSESYTAQATYDLSPRNIVTIPILFWLKPIPLLPKSIGETQFGIHPSKFNLQGTVKKSYSTSLNNQNYRSASYNRTFTGGLNLSWPIFSSMNADYSLQTNRDIRESDNVKFSFNPSEVVLGIELENTQTFNLNYSPKLFRWLTHSMTYRASYRENADPARNQFGTRNVNNGNTITLKGSFSPKTFFGTGASKPKPRVESDSTSGGGFSLHKPFLSFIRFFTNRLGDISGSYSIDNKYTFWGLEERPTWRYILGFENEPGVAINEDAISGSARDVNTQSKSYSASTNVSFILGSKINTKYSRNEKTSNVRNNKSVGTSFPDLSLTLSNLERYGFIRFFFNTLSIDTRYSVKEDETFSAASGERLADRNTNTSYSPLLKLNFTWFRKLNCNFQYDISESLKEQFVPDVDTIGEQIITRSVVNNGIRSSSNSWQFTVRATLSSAGGTNIPLLGRLKSTLTFNLSISQKHSKTENNQYTGSGWTTTSEKTDFTIMPRISYSFSSNINGGLNARWQDSTDEFRFQKSHVRELGIWVEINF